MQMNGTLATSQDEGVTVRDWALRATGQPTTTLASPLAQLQCPKRRQKDTLPLPCMIGGPKEIELSGVVVNKRKLSKKLVRAPLIMVYRQIAPSNNHHSSFLLGIYLVM